MFYAASHNRTHGNVRPKRFDMVTVMLLHLTTVATLKLESAPTLLERGDNG